MSRGGYEGSKIELLMSRFGESDLIVMKVMRMKEAFFLIHVSESSLRKQRK
jgi:hypothetical protein